MQHLADALNQLSAVCRHAADKWYHNPATGEKIVRNHAEQFMLMVSEISEAMEGKRKNLMDDKLPHRPMVEVELADCLIRMFDYAGENGLDLGGAFLDKMRYNEVRKDHTNEARCAPNGKKF